MLMLIRQIVSIVALPGMVLVAVPVWIARRNQIAFSWPDDLAGAAIIVCGVALLGAGVGLFAWSVYFFWTRGRGTLAPWDPPRRFVAEGPYRFVRNPMISGVIFVLLGEACVMRARPLAEWAGLFILINVIFIPLAEEPMLAAKFGQPYVRYKENVRRFVPRLKPWNGSG